MATLPTYSNVVHISAIAYFKNLNEARSSGDYGNTKPLLDSLTEHGWIPDGDGTLVVEEITPELLEQATKDRIEQHEALKNLVKIDPSKSVDLAVWEEIYLDKGKYRPIRFTGITGNRRNSQYFVAMVARRNNKPEPKPITTEIPVRIEKFSSPIERLLCQLRENNFKTMGFLETSPLDNLLAARRLMQLGATQADLRRAYKAGTGQKVWEIVTLDARFPKLNLIDRMKLKPDDPAYIHLPGLDKESMRILNVRSSPQALADYNSKRKTKGEQPALAASETDVAEYFAKGGQTGNKPKILSRDNIDGIRTTHPNAFVRLTAEAIMANNTDLIDPLISMEKGCNILYNAHKDNRFVEFEQLLIAANNCPTAEFADRLKLAIDAFAKRPSNNQPAQTRQKVSA